MAKNSANAGKRQFLKLLAIPPLFFVSKLAMYKQKDTILVDNDIVIINGWVLLKSDFY